MQGLIMTSKNLTTYITYLKQLNHLLLELIHCTSWGTFCKYISIKQGWTPRPAGNPPRGEGGVPRPAPLCGEGGVPRPVKMIKTAGKWRGKIKARISNRRNQ